MNDKSNKERKMTDKQAVQCEKLDIEYNRDWTIHDCARVVSQALARRAK